MINHVAENHSDELMPLEAAEHEPSSPCRDDLSIGSTGSDFPVGDNNTGGLLSVDTVAAAHLPQQQEMRHKADDSLIDDPDSDANHGPAPPKKKARLFSNLATFNHFSNAGANAYYWQLLARA